MTPSPLRQSESLSPVDERLCRLLAAGELTQAAVARHLRLGRATIVRRLAEPAIQARIAALREAFRNQAMLDEPFADKRVRVVTLGAAARDTLNTLREHDYEEPYYYGPDALEAKRFDAPRMETFRKFLRDIAEEVGDRGGAQSGTQVAVVVKVYTDPRLGDAGALEATWDDAPPPRSSADR